MHDIVLVGIVTEQLKANLASSFANSGRLVEDLLPSRVVGHFVNNQNVLHPDYSRIPTPLFINQTQVENKTTAAPIIMANANTILTSLVPRKP